MRDQPRSRLPPRLGTGILSPRLEGSAYPGSYSSRPLRVPISLAPWFPQPQKDGVVFAELDNGMEHAYFVGILSKLLSLVSLDRPGVEVSAVEKKFVRPREKPFNYETATSFVLEFCRLSCVSLITFVASVVYLTRAVKSGQIRILPSSWRLLWVTSITLAEKFWEDNYVAPSHLRSTLQQFDVHLSAREFLVLQQALFKALEWKLDIPVPEFHSLMTSLLNNADPRVRRLVTVGSCFTPRPLPKPPMIEFASPATSTTTASDHHRDFRDFRDYRDYADFKRSLKVHDPVPPLVPLVRPPTTSMLSGLAQGRGYPSLAPRRENLSPVPPPPGARLSRDRSDKDISVVSLAAGRGYPSLTGIRGTTSPVPPPPHVVPREATQLDRGIREAFHRDAGRLPISWPNPASLAPPPSLSSLTAPRLFAGYH